MLIPDFYKRWWQMISDHKELESEMLPSDTSDETQVEIGAENFSDALRMTSEAVTMLADRLNAVALRVALIGSAKSEPTPSGRIEMYLHRLSSLVDSAAAQMRFIQKLLRVMQINAPAQESQPGAVSNLRSARPKESEEIKE